MDYISEYIRDNKIYDLSDILEREIQDKDEFSNRNGRSYIDQLGFIRK